MRTSRRAGALALALLLAWSTGRLFAQGRRVAITVDDLPYASGGAAASSLSEEQHTAETVNRKLLAAFERHRVPVTGFVIQKRVEALGLPVGTRILESWIDRGFDLGNHTYSHPDTNPLSAEQVEREIVEGETTVRPLMKAAGKPLVYFRFPMNQTGNTREKHDSVAAFLSGRGYRLAVCTIENSDYLFNAAYVRALANKDSAFARKLRAEYLLYTSAEIDYYAALNHQVLGYEPPEVMLLHDNRLNSDMIERVLSIFENKRYRFVSLEEAEADPAYGIPDTYVTKFGPMWGYRWAAERNVKVNGALEPEPPKWVLDYGK